VYSWCEKPFYNSSAVEEANQRKNAIMYLQEFYDIRTRIYNNKIEYVKEQRKRFPNYYSPKSWLNEVLMTKMYFGRQTGATTWLSDIIGSKANTNYVVVLPNTHMLKVVESKICCDIFDSIHLTTIYKLDGLKIKQWRKHTHLFIDPYEFFKHSDSQLILNKCLKRFHDTLEIVVCL